MCVPISTSSVGCGMLMDNGQSRGAKARVVGWGPRLRISADLPDPRSDDIAPNLVIPSSCSNSLQTRPVWVCMGVAK